VVHGGRLVAGGVDDLAGVGRVVIGENMARVQRYAEQIEAEVFKGEGMAENLGWIQDAVRAGKEVIDIGPDFTRRLTRALEGVRPDSAFYNMERMQTSPTTCTGRHLSESEDLRAACQAWIT
jgi:hypothetical protein